MKGFAIGLACILLSTGATGCSGKLSKDEAHQLIQKSFFAGDDNAYCIWRDGFAQDWGEDNGNKRYLITNEDKYFRSCTADMMSAGILKSVGCGDEHCSRNMYVLGPGVDLNGAHAVQFVCGKRSLADITSVSTEGRRATVKYNVAYTRNKEQARALPNCQIVGPLDGQELRTAHLDKDDDGHWTVSNQ